MLPQFARSTSRIEPLAIEPISGLSQNWQQFSLLVLVNAFVGAMVGLERAVLPLWAAADFGLASNSAILSFIVAFGVVKAVTNLVAGRQAERLGRKSLLVAGWIAGLPVPFMLLWAPSWAWVTAANMLLGVNQGLCWSTTVVMKIDLAGPRRRGLAMGLNEFAGYGAVAAGRVDRGDRSRCVRFPNGSVCTRTGVFARRTVPFSVSRPRHDDVRRA